MSRPLIIIAGSLAMTPCAAPADILGYVDFDGFEIGLIAYRNSAYTYAGGGMGTDASQVSVETGTTTNWPAGSAFWPMIRSVEGPNGVGMPAELSDDGVIPAEGNALEKTDRLGFAGLDLDGNGFFGVAATENEANSGPMVAEFVFDVANTDVSNISVDVIVMGDFEVEDGFAFEYCIDDGPFIPLRSTGVEENYYRDYTMDNPDVGVVRVDNPLSIITVRLADEFHRFTNAAFNDGGSTLTVRYTARCNGSGGFGFDNLIIRGGRPPQNPALTYETSCPDAGPATLTATGGGSGPTAFFYSHDGLGSFMIPRGSTCAGAELLMSPPFVLAGIVHGDPAILTIPNVPASACGIAIAQALNLDTCQTSGCAFW